MREKHGATVDGRREGVREHELPAAAKDDPALKRIRFSRRFPNKGMVPVRRPFLMGKTRDQEQPAPEKLRKIRTSLGLSQNEFIRRLGLTAELFQANISGYELGTRKPALPILLKYGQVAGVCLDVLVNDALNLPEKLPSAPIHQGSIGVRDSRSSQTARDQITSLATHLKDGLLTINHAGLILFVNEPASAISGYQEHEIVGQLLAELFPAVGSDGQSHPARLALQSRGTVTYRSKPRGKEIELTIIPVGHSVDAAALPCMQLSCSEV